jgi:hypothetical protein
VQLYGANPAPAQPAGLKSIFFGKTSHRKFRKWSIKGTKKGALYGVFQNHDSGMTGMDGVFQVHHSGLTGIDGVFEFHHSGMTGFDGVFQIHDTGMPDFLCFSGEFL